MSKQMQEAMSRAVESLNAMPDDEYFAMLEEHKDGDIAQFVLDTGGPVFQCDHCPDYYHIENLLFGKGTCFGCLANLE